MAKKLSEIIESLVEKYPDDEDVLEAQDNFLADLQAEDEEEAGELNPFDPEGDMGEGGDSTEEGPMDMESLLAEDMDEMPSEEVPSPEEDEMTSILGEEVSMEEPEADIEVEVKAGKEKPKPKKKGKPSFPF